MKIQVRVCDTKKEIYVNRASKCEFVVQLFKQIPRNINNCSQKVMFRGEIMGVSSMCIIHNNISREACDQCKIDIYISDVA